MSSTVVAVGVLVAAFASGAAGLAVARARRRRAAGGAPAAFVGLLCLLLAAQFALGLSSAYEAARARGEAVRRLAAEALALDLDLRLYGEGAAPLREALSADLALARALVAGEAAAAASAGAAAYSGVAAMRGRLARLSAPDETQRRLLASADARFEAFAALRLDLALQADAAASGAPSLAALASACVALFGVGALGRVDAAAFAALLMCAATLAGTYYATMELNRPYPVLPGDAPGALEQAMAELGR